MKNKISVKLFLYTTIFTVFGHSLSAQLLDPRTRSEDITDTTVSVVVSQNENGHYLYSYTLEAGMANEAEIGSFRIKLACETVEETDFDKSFYRTRAEDPKADLATYSPVVMQSYSGTAVFYGINSGKEAHWSVFQEPGKTGHIKLISPYGPKMRDYRILPTWGIDQDDLYDYSEIEESTPNIPKIDDFILRGMIEAPGCSADIVEPPSDYGIFKGSSKKNESENENLLLTYSSPILDNPHYSADTDSVEFTIHYAQDIAPQTFEAKVNTLKKNEIAELFNPIPGTVQTISIPFKVNKDGKKKKGLKIEFKVNAVCDAFITDDADDKTLEKCEKEGNKKFKDTDKFKLKLEKSPKGEMEDIG